MRRLGIVVLACGMLASPAARAVQPDEMMRDPALEARARALSSQLRCMVCQNQSIDDSDAPLARDIRLIVREHLKVGDNEAAIRRFLVARYGNFILLEPPFNAETWLLWLTPALALMFGGMAIWQASRKSGRRAASGPLSEAEKTRLDSALGNESRDFHKV